MKHFFQKGMAALTLFSVSISSASADRYGVDDVRDLDGSGGGGLKENVVTYIQYFLTFLGILAVVMIIYAGVLMVTAQGEEDQIKKGKKIITWAAVGIIVIMLSFVIVEAIIGAGSGAEG